MTKASDNPFPSALFADQGSTPSTPAAGHSRIFTKSDGAYVVDDGGGVTGPFAASAGPAAAINPGTCQGRLTLTTGVPVTTADVTAATTLYFTPYKGNLISTYSGTAWSMSTFTEKSITLASLTANKPYDVFIVDSTLALELLAWTNTTTRATALVLQDGVYCKTGALTRRYLGTICITGTTGQCEDSILHRLVWNYYNQLQRELAVVDTTNTWTYATATWRQANASTANQFDFVIGVSEVPVEAFVQATARVQDAYGTVGIGLDATNANSARIWNRAYAGTNTNRHNPIARYNGYPGIGYHYLAWLEYCGFGTVTFEGDDGATDEQSGMMGEVWG